MIKILCGTFADLDKHGYRLDNHFYPNGDENGCRLGAGLCSRALQYDELTLIKEENEN